MANTPEKDDDQWLDALAGRTDPTADPKLNIQAESLRRALKARAEKLESQVPYADEAQYQQLLFRLRREKLLTTNGGWRESAAWLKVAKIMAVPSDVAIGRNPAVWGMAAVLVLGVALVIQSAGNRHKQEEVDVLKGGQNTVLLVAEPEKRLSEILIGIRAAGEEPVVTRTSDGSIVLKVNGSVKVLDYFSTQRIEPMVIEGKVTIVITRPKANPK